MEIQQQLKERLRLLTDNALLDMVEGQSTEYTAEARAMIDEEIAKRGGIEVVKEKAKQSEKPLQSKDDLDRLKKFFFVTVIAACGLFIFAVKGSYWFYWLCLFAMIAGLLAVLFKPKYNPEDEIKELLSKRLGEEYSGPEDKESGV